jgi:hypothetical protein
LCARGQAQRAVNNCVTTWIRQLQSNKLG